MHRTEIRAVVFDYGQVLSRSQDPALRDRLHALADMPRGDFEAQYWRYRVPYDRGELDGRAYWARVLGTTTAQLELQRLADLVATDAASWLRLDDVMVGWAATLRESGIRTAILSNMPHDVLAGLADRHGALLDQFDPAVFSCDAGAVKPEVPIYRMLLDQLRMDAPQVLFIDDRAENVDAARSLGMHAICHESIEQLQRVLGATYALPLPAEAR